MNDLEQLVTDFRWVLVALAAGSVAIAPGCGSTNGALAGGSSRGGVDGGPLGGGFNASGASAGTGATGTGTGAANTGTGATTAGASGATGSGGAGTVGAGGAACTGVACGVGTTHGTKTAGTTCTNPDECQSGRCEPAVTGTTGEVCLSACFADGVACTRSLDCCSTGCHGGICGKDLCTLEGDPCKSNADCCSNICTQGECQIDHANRDCRPTGESCTSGEGRGCCNTCDDATSRCAFGADTCFAQGVACKADTDCCHGICAAGVCKTPCEATGAACTSAADCCTADCSAGGKCVLKNPPPTPADAGTGVGAGGAATGAGGAGTPPPPPAACVLVGDRCTTSAQCCSDVCFGGFCEAAIQ